MPNNPRQQTKRKLEQAINAIDNAMIHLHEASAQYRPGVHDYKPEGYPEFFEPIDNCAVTLTLAQDIIKELKGKV